MSPSYSKTRPCRSTVFQIAFTIIITASRIPARIASPVLATFLCGLGSPWRQSITPVPWYLRASSSRSGSDLTQSCIRWNLLARSRGELVTKPPYLATSAIPQPVPLSYLLFGAAPPQPRAKRPRSKATYSSKGSANRRGIDPRLSSSSPKRRKTQKELKLSSIEHSSRPEDLDALRASSDGVITILRRQLMSLT